jgi:alpha-galactosidase
MLINRIINPHIRRLGTLLLLTGALHSLAFAAPTTVWLDELKIEKTYQAMGKPQRNKSTVGNPLSIGGVKFERGLGTWSETVLYIRLDGGSTRFSASVGVDDGVIKSKVASVEFFVIGDGKRIWESGVMLAGQQPKTFSVDVTGMKSLVLQVGWAGNYRFEDHANWADAKFEVVGTKPVAGEAKLATVEPYILTPKAPETPRVNGPALFGVRPGSPFLYTIPATGKRPMSFAVKNLPAGLSLDEKTGQITGELATKGEHRVTLVASNSLGTNEKAFKIVCGDQIALTPPMGWNSWTVLGHAPSQEGVEAAARLMVSTGLINHGWSYVNVDDNWMNSRDAQDPFWKKNPERFFDPVQQGPRRNANGDIATNVRFTSMKAMADTIHSLGLKAGLYCSPGPYTCGNGEGSFQHEKHDAETFAAWGFDYLKYDFCFYDSVTHGKYPEATDYPRWDYISTDKPEGLVYPYRLMGKHLREQKRDIYYSLCEYGRGYPWKWGASVNGNGWRTTIDIMDTWESMTKIGFYYHDETAPYQKPGQWNDPDTLVIGYVGGWEHKIRPTRLNPDEQYTQVSLWSLFSAPLLIGLDMTKLDDFTYNLISNDEVIAIDQDPLGIQATCKLTAGDLRVYPKPMEDGSLAVGFFNMYTGEMKQDFAEFAKLGLKGKYRVRDVWRQQDIAVIDAASGKLSLTIPGHGVRLYRLYPIK